MGVDASLVHTFKYLYIHVHIVHVKGQVGGIQPQPPLPRDAEAHHPEVQEEADLKQVHNTYIQVEKGVTAGVYIIATQKIIPPPPN